MSTDITTEKKEYLSYAIGYLENRISMIDHRSSFLIAAHGILFAVYVKFVETAFINPVANPQFTRWSIAFICVAFLLLAISVFLLLKTIRPSGFPLGFKIDPQRLKGVKSEFLWPGKGWCDLPDHYERAFEELDNDKILEGYKNTNFVLLGHVERKMRYYKWATILIKYLVVLYIVSVPALYFLRS